jgi:hypothetical protein
MLSWAIISISSQAWTNGLYNVIIKLNEKIEIIWWTATIKISSNTNKVTIPLNIVNPLDKDNGYIYILKNNEPEILNVKLWEIRWDQIEVLSDISPDTQIITNNISNYNTKINSLILK